MPKSNDPTQPKTPSRRTRSRRSSSGGITLEDVARLAGVSTITVSRVLNQPDRVAADTLRKVTQAIDRTGYVPNLLAGGLASRRTHLIAAIVPSITNLVYAETIQYFSARLKESGYQVLLGESGYLDEDELSLITAILSRRPDGILLTGVNHSIDCRRRLLAANTPLVETWDLTPTPLDIVVGFSHERVGDAVADYLAKKSYRRIGTVFANDGRAQVRQQAMLKRLKDYDINHIEISEVPVPTDLHRGRLGLAQLIDRGFRTGAVCCSSDTLALGVLIEAQARGIRVPDDLAVLGFGDQVFAADLYPALSTIRINRPRIGRLAAEALLARINCEPVNNPAIDVGFEIVERETT